MTIHFAPIESQPADDLRWTAGDDIPDYMPDANQGPYATSQRSALVTTRRVEALFPQDGISRMYASSANDAALPQHVAIRMQQLRGQGMPKNTRRGYESAWRYFEEWCRLNHLRALPASPSTLIHYLIERSDTVTEEGAWRYAPGTIQFWVSGINKVHELARLPLPGHHPDVKELLVGVRREKARVPRRVLPLTLSPLTDILSSIDLNSHPAGVKGHRDFAILLLGFAGAFRRSEVAGLEISKLKLGDAGGLHLHLTRSKTDQEARGQTKGIPFGNDPLTCPPCALRRWLLVLVAAKDRADTVKAVLAQSTTARHICSQRGGPHLELPPDQPMFPALLKGGRVTPRPSGGQTVANIIKSRVFDAGMDPTQYSGHSLRAGFVTQAYRSGATTHEIMRQTGHRNPATVEIYSRETDPLLHNAVQKLGL